MDGDGSGWIKRDRSSGNKENRRTRERVRRCWRQNENRISAERRQGMGKGSGCRQNSGEFFKTSKKRKAAKPVYGHPVQPPAHPSPTLHCASLIASLTICSKYLLVVLRSGAENSQFWSTRFRFWRFTRINETHDERFQMLTFLQWQRR